MDTNAFVIAPLLVEGGAEGLDRIAEALRQQGLPIEGVYLVRLGFEDGGSEWVIRIVSPATDQRSILVPALSLRRAARLPAINEKVRFSPLRPDHPEAARILAYARKYRERPLQLEGIGLDGLYVDYALVGSSIPAAA